MTEFNNLLNTIAQVGLVFGIFGACVLLDIWAQKLSDRRCRLAARAEAETYLRRAKRL